MDLDFVGFTYNGKHSYRDLKIYRTSNGGRYEENILPTLTEKTASVDGMVGQYYFGTQVGPRTLNISFAFDDVTEAGLQEIKRTFCGDGIHDLIFDEEPYKVYSAKVTGTATVKHLCFDKEGNRRYRGEGNVQFTCYYPYAHSRNSTSTLQAPSDKKVSGTSFKPLNCGIMVGGTETLNFVKPDGNIESYSVTVNYITVNGTKQKLLSGEPGTESLQESSLCYITSVEYDITMQSGFSLGDWLPQLIVGGITYAYVQYAVNGKTCFKSSGTDGRVLNNYSSVEYPNKWEWGQACNLPLHSRDSQNHGDIDTCFEWTGIYSYLTGAENKILPNSEITATIDEGIGSISIVIKILEEITITEPNDVTIKWNSKTGIITKTINGNTTLLKCSGESLGSIPKDASIRVSLTCPSVTCPFNKNEGIPNFDYLYY